MIYFISGHRDITKKEFQKYYAKKIMDSVLKYPDTIEFVVGDYFGVDAMAQEYLFKLQKNYPAIKVTVYHMFTEPRNNMYTFPTCGGFADDYSRDTAMTMNSDDDIAWVRSGKQTSGTAQNLVRRQIKTQLFSCTVEDATGMIHSFDMMLGYHPKIHNI